MIPEDDRGPSWLRDYQITDFSQIEADIEAMEKFAAQLAANVQDSYAPHMSTVSTDMVTQLPEPDSRFAELQSFLMVHRDAQDVSHQNVYNYANGTHSFALAAQDVGKKYAGSDAFSHAKVSDVDNALDHYGIPTDLTGPGPTEGDL